MARSGADIGSAYDGVTELYVELFLDALAKPESDQHTLQEFADAVRHNAAGPVIDAGCGPGHVAAHLANLDLDVLGIDISAAMINAGRTHFPHIPFVRGDIRQLPLGDASVSGVLSRYASIHFPADDLATAVLDWARVIAPGGHLLMSFHGTDEPAQHGDEIPNTVTAAYRADADAISELLVAAGMTELSRSSRPGPKQRPYPQMTVHASK